MKLAGQVNSYAEKINTEKAAGRVAGLRTLALDIDVRLASVDVRSDIDIAIAAISALQWNTLLSCHALRVVVNDGWLHLSGWVDWEYQRQAAFNALRCLTGVKGVDSYIQIMPKVSLNNVKRDVESALKRQNIAAASTIEVSVTGADVTLGGSVMTWSERELARYSAWNTAGVQDVIDNIVVTIH